MARIYKLQDVVDWRMCIGCGACAYICPNDSVQLFDFFAEGIRPVVDAANCTDCRQCLDVCPAVQSDFRTESQPPEPAKDSTREWGPITAIWEGHATNEEIRYKGSSGGALTALAAYCLERLNMEGVLHIAQDPADPIRNRTQLSQSREELLAATGSRYSPASVCNGLDLVESARGSCVIIGKPAEISAVKNARRMRPELDRKIGVTMSFFCAETPSTQGTVALLQELNVDPANVSGLRYRGHGWPGYFAPTPSGETSPTLKLTYSKSWAFLQAFRPWSVQLWPDCTGELADISCGDPWYEKPDGRNPGFSLVVARTELGRRIVEGAIEAEYLSLRPAEHWKLVRSQSGLLTKKGSIWGRRIIMNLFGLPPTRFSGLHLWHCWKRVSLRGKIRATLGTARRILNRKLYRRLQLDVHTAKKIVAPTRRSGIRTH